MKHIKNPNEIVDALVADFQTVFGDGLLSVVMYGSAASHEYKPGISDINVVMVVREDSIPTLEKCISITNKWAKHRVSIPFFMTEEFISSAKDAYPIEFLDIQSNYRILHGTDFFSHLDIKGEHIRLQCERELRGCALHVRKEYIRSAGNPRQLKQLLSLTMKKLLPVFKAMVVLNNKPVPKLRGDVVMAIEDLYNLGASALSEAFNLFDKKTPSGGWTVLFDNVVKAIDSLIVSVDRKD